MTLFVTFYLAIVLVWPFRRFASFGVWPLVMLFPAAGVAAAWQATAVRQHRTHAASVTAVVVLCPATLAFNARIDSPGVVYEDRHARDLQR